MSQTDLNKRCSALGMGKYDASRLEQKKKAPPFNALRRHGLAQVLRVPERWFTEESVDQVVGLETQESELSAMMENISRLEVESAARDAEALERIDEVLRAIRALRPPLPP